MPEPNSYLASDFERYHRGQMSPAERHALEKAALEDPFLSEAMDGYAYSEDAVAEMDELQVKLNKRVRKHKNQVILLFARVAVAALLVIAAGTFFFIKSGPTPYKETASYQKQPTTHGEWSDSIHPQKVTGSDSVTLLSSTLMPVANDSQPLIRNSSLLASNTSLKEKKIESDYAEANLITKAEDITNSIAAEPFNNKMKDATDIVITDSSLKASANTSSVKNAGTTVSPQENPVNITSLQEAVVTTGRINKQRQQVNTKYITLRDQLVADSLSNAASYSVEDFLNKEAEPEIGWKAYNEYLNTNKKLPAPENPSDNEAVILFTLTPKNKMTHFRVESSINEAYDAEAIRLIREGPAWKNLKNKRVLVKVLVAF